MLPMCWGQTNDFAFSIRLVHSGISHWLVWILCILDHTDFVDYYHQEFNAKINIYANNVYSTLQPVLSLYGIRLTSSYDYFQVTSTITDDLQGRCVPQPAKVGNL